MKRFCFGACLLIAISMLKAQERGICCLFYYDIVVDGIAENYWDILPKYVPEVTNIYGNYAEPTLNEYWFKIAWKDTAFFILTYRNDDDFTTEWESGLSDWINDRDELYFDIYVENLDDGYGASLDNDGKPCTGADAGHYQFFSDWQPNATGDSILPGFSAADSGAISHWYHYRPFYFGYQVEGNTYTAEYAIPFTSLAISSLCHEDADSTFQAEKGVTFGFEIAVADLDMYDNPTNESFRKFTRWADVDSWDSMDGAGKITIDYCIGNVNTVYDNLMLKIFPNPATTHVTIEPADPIPAATVSLLDATGREWLRRKTDIQHSITLDIHDLPAGMYLVRVANRDFVLTNSFMKTE